MGQLLETLTPETQETLTRYRFDEEQFTRLQAKVRSGELSPESNRIQGEVEPTGEEDLTPLPDPDSGEHAEVVALGEEALARGEVASVVLNGGMATRFGGVVKGTVEAYGGKSFLAHKLEQAARVGERYGKDVPVALMNSYATDEATRTHLGGLETPEPLVFQQYVSLRMERDGELLRRADGEVSLYGPGHGDLLEAIRESGTLEELTARGVKHVMVSNVDNLPATLDPAVIGTHLREGRAMSVEVARNRGAVGGSPVRVDGKVMIVEAMRYPEGLDAAALPAINVNTALLTTEALSNEIPLTWVHVTKEVEGRPAVQLERMYHEASATLETTYLLVPVTGPRSRFLPIKTPADLEKVQDELAQVLEGAPTR